MNFKEHCERHRQLHAALDELSADFLSHNKTKNLSDTSILELVMWSAAQQYQPTEQGEMGSDEVVSDRHMKKPGFDMG